MEYVTIKLEDIFICTDSFYISSEEKNYKFNINVNDVLILVEFDIRPALTDISNIWFSFIHVNSSNKFKCSILVCDDTYRLLNDGSLALDLHSFDVYNFAHYSVITKEKIS